MGTLLRRLRVSRVRIWRNWLIMSLALAALLTLLVLSQQTAPVSGVLAANRKLKTLTRTQDVSEVVHILMRLPMLHLSQPNAVHRYQENFEWLLAYSSLPLHLHLAVPRDSFKLLDQILLRANGTTKVKCEVSRYDYKEFTDQLSAVAHVDFGQERDFSESVANHMPALLLPFHFLQLKRLIVAEADIVLRADVAELYAHFRHFAPAQLVGVAQQQVPKYRKAFAMYEKYNPASGLGKPQRPGFNTALLLLDVQKMRHSMKLNAYLHYPSLRWLVHKYWLTKDDGEGGTLTQDDVFTLMGFEHPELFYVLPCGWNRQLDAPGYSQNEAREYNHCDGKLYAENVQDAGGSATANHH